MASGLTRQSEMSKGPPALFLARKFQLEQVKNRKKGKGLTEFKYEIFR